MIFFLAVGGATALANQIGWFVDAANPDHQNHDHQNKYFT
jgi:hypothetical protein